MVPPVIMAPLVAGLVFGLIWRNTTIALVGAIGGLFSAFLIAWPLLFMMIDNARETPLVRTTIGIVCGIAPLAAAVLAGVIGLYFRSTGFDYVGRVLEHGAPIPYFGSFPWSSVARIAMIAAVCGVTTLWLSNAVSALGSRRR